MREKAIPFATCKGGLVMTQAQAILGGAIFFVAAIFAINIVRPASATNGGPYQLMHHSNTGANAGVFRIDTTTGEVSYCFVAGNSGLDLMCTKPVR
jgi:hypothetical protein